MKSLHLILVLFSIASMFTSFGVYDVDATKDDNNGKAKGCDNANDNSKVKEKNPNCDFAEPPPEPCDVSADPTGDCDGDGLDNTEDFCPDNSIGTNTQMPTDHDGDGVGNSIDIDPCDPDVP
jgi:hypothetical protein